MAITDMTTTEVILTPDELRAPRFTPRELRMVADQYGRPFSAIVTDEGTDDKFVVLAWLKLRRDGLELDWAEMDDVLIRFEVAAPDPTNGPPPTTSPSSAATGE